MEAQGVVYLGGIEGNDNKFVWYKVDIGYIYQMKMNMSGETSKCLGKRKRRLGKHFSIKGHGSKYQWMVVKKSKPQTLKLDTPAASLNIQSFGSCTMVCEQIYWFGDHGSSMKLLNHKINTSHDSWGILDSPLNMVPLYSYCILSHLGNKLYVLRNPEDKSPEILWGDIYDLHTHQWFPLVCNVACPRIRSYGPPYIAVDEQKKELLFYSLYEGSIIFYNSTTCQWRLDQNHCSLALLNPIEPYPYFPLLDCVARYISGVLSDNTLYWFTPDLSLYGYDINLGRWFKSSSLEKQLPTIEPSNECTNYCPFLVGLPSGKLLLVCPEAPGKVTLAPLTVYKKKDKDSLNVRVDSFHPLSLGDTFFPICNMAMLKNAQSDTSD